MIVKSVDFTQLFDSLWGFFTVHLSKERLSKIEDQLVENIRILANANLKCYQSNMTVMVERKKDKVDTQLISDMELQARTVGERRVKAKAAINALLNRTYPLMDEKKIVLESWMSDDIVYSVGEMIDRLTIEFIKVSDYKMRLDNIEQSNEEIKQLNSKIAQSKKWSRRVEKYLNWKLKEIDKKGHYECLEETRTYNLNDIQ